MRKIHTAIRRLGYLAYCGMCRKQTEHDRPFTCRDCGN